MPPLVSPLKVQFIICVSLIIITNALYCYTLNANLVLNSEHPPYLVKLLPVELKILMVWNCDKSLESSPELGL